MIFANASNGVEVAHLESAVFEDVTSDDIADAQFKQEELDVPFQPGLVILIRTDNGVVFKLGNPSENGSGLSFDYEPL